MRRAAPRPRHSHRGHRQALTAAWDTVVPLPAAIGLDDHGTRPLGVIISHGHQDHWGLAPQLPATYRERAGRLVLFGAYQGEIPSMIRDGRLTGGAVVWSMWDGYLDQPSGQRLQAALHSVNVPLIQHHTPGHATPADLARLVRALRPDTVVPIHTEAPDAYASVVGQIVQPTPGRHLVDSVNGARDGPRMQHVGDPLEWQEKAL